MFLKYLVIFLTKVISEKLYLLKVFFKNKLMAKEHGSTPKKKKKKKMRRNHFIHFRKKTKFSF